MTPEARPWATSCGCTYGDVQVYGAGEQVDLGIAGDVLKHKRPALARGGAGLQRQHQGGPRNDRRLEDEHAVLLDRPLGIVVGTARRQLTHTSLL